MEAVSFLNSWVNWFFILIPIITALVVAYHGLGMITGDEDKYIQSKDKIINTLKAAIVIWAIDGFIVIVQSFY